MEDYVYYAISGRIISRKVYIYRSVIIYGVITFALPLFCLIYALAHESSTLDDFIAIMQIFLVFISIFVMLYFATIGHMYGVNDESLYRISFLGKKKWIFHYNTVTSLLIVGGGMPTRGGGHAPTFYKVIENGKKWKVRYPHIVLYNDGISHAKYMGEYINNYPVGIVDFMIDPKEDAPLKLLNHVLEKTNCEILVDEKLVMNNLYLLQSLQSDPAIELRIRRLQRN